MSTDERATPWESEWRWRREPEWLPSAHDRAAALAEVRVAGLPGAVRDNEAVTERPIALDAQVMARRGANFSSLPRRRQP